MNAAELQGMAADAAAADKAQAAEPGASAAPGEAAAPKLSAADEWAQVPAVFGRILSRFYPELEPVYSEKACAEWGRAMVPVAEKYGWTASRFFAWLGPWIGLAMASESLATPTYQALAARVRAARAAKAAPEGAAASDGAPPPSP